ncbi:hypothetical protein F511_31229 [Dorcoceras hygrometricum]|uniref:Uncharacterized protein n=1 Tax=Dorcoceras hygrometricum TaxID=472368 RepID=A0A2Z7BKT6_9LAMI|nr:hypothetical protein F511_31229 [Dorcoceras hygrometricum]
MQLVLPQVKSHPTNHLRLFYPDYNNQNSLRCSQLVEPKLRTARNIHSSTARSNRPAQLCTRRQAQVAYTLLSLQYIYQLRVFNLARIAQVSTYAIIPARNGQPSSQGSYSACDVV